MTGPWSRRLRGQLDEHELTSEALRGNPLGDPHERPLWVYTPPSYAGGPAVYVLQGFTGQLDMWRNRAAFRPTVLELPSSSVVFSPRPISTTPAISGRCR